MKPHISFKNILILGSSGLLGDYACRFFARRNLQVFAMSRTTSHLHHDQVHNIQVSGYNVDEISKFITKNKINVVLNCVGLTNVEECQSKPKLAFELNSQFPGKIAEVCAQTGTNLVHISTDHFGKCKSQLLSEEERDLTLLNKYAESKRDGELQVLKSCPTALVVRTNFFGNSLSEKLSFSDTIISTLKKGNKISLFTDVFYTPIDMATMLCLTSKLIKIKRGIINICSDKAITKYEFGVLVAEQCGLDTNLIIPTLRTHRSDLTNRPENMSLSVSKLKHLFPQFDLTIETSVRQLKQ
jgi:dTDP-4-dehydrorhamnose reductase